MGDHRLTTAAVEGFKESLQLANDLVVGIVRAPLAVVSSFIHHETRKKSAAPKPEEQSKRIASTRG
jgi:hypothetical protein